MDSERLFVESLFQNSIDSKKIQKQNIVNIDALTGDASTRRYYRLITDLDSYVICLDNPLKAGERYPFEVVQSFLKKENITVPEIYDVDVEKGYLLEEDLGNETLIQYLARLKSREEELDLYKQCLDIIIRLQSIPEGSFKNMPFSQVHFDEKKLMEELNFSIKYFLSSYLGLKEEASEIVEIEQSLQNLCRELASFPRVLAHRDFHSRNIMVKNKKLYLIDFQDLRMGLSQYDLASFLDDAYYEVSANNQEKLFLYFWEQTKERQVATSLDEFTRLYDLMAIQRILKALGTFAFIYSSREDARYLKFIGRSFENLKGYLFKYPEFTNLRQHLSQFYYEH